MNDMVDRSSSSTSLTPSTANPSSLTEDDPGTDLLYQLSENWLELESDPGLFTLLIRDFGCPGAEVEEIYDLQSSFTDQVYGFIFLFNVIEERRNRNQRHVATTNFTSPSSLSSGHYIMDENFLNEMFFAYQKVPNSCATHAILSVLLNCSQLLDIGPTLKRLKEYTKDMTPENKGFAISNMAELAKAHNSHAAAYSNQREQLKQHSNAVRVSQRNSVSVEAFHFVSFVPIKGRLIELDGLKEYPIDHGPIDPEELWTEKFRKLIRQRIETSEKSSDIRYNLMAVIPNKYHCLKRSLKRMERHRILLLKILHFVEFYSTLQIYYEHNYAKFDVIETIQESFSTSFLPKNHIETKIKIGSDSITFVDDHGQMRQEPFQQNRSRSSSSSSTDTASDASSTFNFAFEQEDDFDNERMNSQEYHKFFICKFEIEKFHNQNISNIKQENEEDISAPSSVPLKEKERELTPKASMESSAEIQKEILKILEQIESKIEEEFEIEESPGVSTKNHITNEDMKLLALKISQSLIVSRTSEHKKRRKIRRISQYHKRIFKQRLKHKKVKKFLRKKLKFKPNRRNKPKFSENKLLESLLCKFRLFKAMNHITQADFSMQLKPLILKDLSRLMSLLNKQINRCRIEYEEEKAKLDRYILDDSRRTHNYDEFIITFLAMASEQGLLDGFLSQELNNPNISYYPLSTPSDHKDSNNIFNGDDDSDASDLYGDTSDSEQSDKHNDNSVIRNGESDDDSSDEELSKNKSKNKREFDEFEDDDTDLDDIKDTPMSQLQLNGFFPINFSFDCASPNANDDQDDGNDYNDDDDFD